MLACVCSSSRAMRGVIVVVCVALLLQGTNGGFSWGSIGQVFKKAGDDIAGEAKRFGDRLAPDVDNVKEELERFGTRLEPDYENVKNFFSGGSNGNSGGQELTVLRILDPLPDATKCSAIIEASLSLDCNLEGESVNCSEPMAVGTVVHMVCQEAYIFLQYPGYNSVTCNSTFFWSDPVIKCVADCGKRVSTGADQLVSNGERALVSEFSWHVGVYKLNRTDQYIQVCGATLVTPGIVISAAHCFWDNKANRALDISLYNLAAGKYHRDWYTEDKETQQRDLAELHIHERFNGLRRNLAYDIAIIQVTEAFKLTWAINTICMDYPGTFEDLQLKPGNNGTVAGWGITENNTQSDVLMSVQLPYVDFLQCGDLVEIPFQKFLTDDKICGGFIHQAISVCPGDSGGGYVFPQMTERGIRYFLRGIVSAGHMPYELWKRCGSQQLSAFTLVSRHRAFVEQHVFNRRISG